MLRLRGSQHLDRRTLLPVGDSMGNWYFVVGLLMGGVSGYVFNKTASSFLQGMNEQDIDGLTVMVVIGMILLWGIFCSLPY